MGQGAHGASAQGKKVFTRVYTYGYSGGSSSTCSHFAPGDTPSLD